MQEDREKVPQAVGVGAGRQFAGLHRLPQPFDDLLGALQPMLSQPDFEPVVFRTDAGGGGDHHAALRQIRPAVEPHGVFQQAFDRRANAAFLREGAIGEATFLGFITGDRLAEQLLFGAERLVDARGSNAQFRHQIRHRGAFVTLSPE